MFGETEANKAMEFAKTLRELDASAEDITNVEDEMDFYEQTATFIRDKYEPVYKDLNAWFESDVEPVMRNVVGSLSTDLPDEVAEIDGSGTEIWDSVIETAQNHGPDFEFGDLIPSPEDWDEDFEGSSGTLVAVAARLERLGVNPFTEQQRRVMRMYAEELRRRAEIISKLAEGEPVT